MVRKDIAKLAHEINLIYCESVGDYTQTTWLNAPEWQKISAIEGIEFAINNPQSTPEDNHNNWLKCKTDDGWVYGEVKDPDKKTHPCCVDYCELPLTQQYKDYLYTMIVKSLVPFLD